MTTETQPIATSEDIIDVRNIIARFEALENRDDLDDDEQTERAMLTTLLADLKGNGGDEQWREDWYPITLIRDSYMEDYAQETAEDIGAISRNARWPLNCIDWEQATDQFKMDYSTVEIDGITFWYR